MKTLMMLLPLLFSGGISLAQQPAFVIESRTSKNDRSSFTSICELRLLEKLPDGKLRIGATQLDYRPGLTSGSRNTAALLDAPLNSTDLLLTMLLLQVPTEIIYDPQGPFPPQPALQQLVEQKAREMGVEERFVKMVSTNAPSYFHKEISAVFLHIPATTTQWFSADTALQFTITRHAGGKHTINAVQTGKRPHPDMTSRANNSYQWDDAAGGLTHASLQFSVKGSYEHMGQRKAYFYEDTTHLSLLPGTAQLQIEPITPALREMIIKTSSWSAALKDAKGLANDSAKTMTFFNEMAPLFGGYKGFIIKRLSAIQALNVVNKNQLYNNALRTVPNHLLAGHFIHLHNKLEDAVEETPDSAVQLIQLLSATSRSSFESWLQRSLAQSAFTYFDTTEMNNMKREWRAEGLSEAKVAEMETPYRERSHKAAIILQKLSLLNDTVISAAARPMYLFMQARSSGNADTLRLVAKQLNALTPGQSRRGNAARYKLMLYKQLRENNLDGEAATMLKDIITTLEKGTLDSLNKARFADQNMLAYAYYLQYEAQKSSDKEQAMVYYAKASAVSPRSAGERAHESFYDRVLLGSEESYREGFANALIKEGDTKEAIKVLAQQVNADPAILSDVQKAFEKHLPGRDFGSFVTNSLVRTWKMAPDFVLTGPDGKVRKLSDYRGKWVLIDFWGTWCQPCRRELPEIEKLYVSLKPEDPSAFLSIACNDTPEKVTRFMDMEKYTFPVAMSNGKVEGEYKVTGYPSKFIISPDGRMLQVAFGLDWERAFEQFSKMTAKSAKQNVSIQLK